MKIIRPMSPLRRRMLEDMQIRNDSPHTLDGSLRYVAQFAKHFDTSPARLGPEHIRTYQLHLLHTQVSESVGVTTGAVPGASRPGAGDRAGMAPRADRGGTTAQALLAPPCRSLPRLGLER